MTFSEKVNCTEAGSRHCPCSLYSLGRATVPRPVTTTVATTLSASFIQTCVRVLFSPVHVSVGSSVGVCDNNCSKHIYWTYNKAKFSHEESKRNFGNLCNLTNLQFANFCKFGYFISTHILVQLLPYYTSKISIAKKLVCNPFLTGSS